MKPLCSRTRQPCPVYQDACDTRGDDCPAQLYKGSSYYYAPGESISGAQGKIDNTCRYYGIKRAWEIRNRNFMEG